MVVKQCHTSSIQHGSLRVVFFLDGSQTFDAFQKKQQSESGKQLSETLAAAFSWWLILRKYKRFAISLKQLKSVLGEDLYNVADVTPEKVSAADIVYAMKQYFTKTVSLSELAAWVNVIWFTELYECDSKEENAIASVMALLEILDEGVAFTPEEYAETIECLEANRECEL